MIQQVIIQTGYISDCYTGDETFTLAIGAGCGFAVAGQ